MDELIIQEIPVTINNDLERRVADIFQIFDTQENKTIDSAEVGTVMRGLGMCPTEAEVQELILQVETANNPGIVHLANFLPKICTLITEHKYQPYSADKLLEAFRLLDEEGKGFLTKDRMRSLMVEYGEPFNQDELDEMLSVAVNPHTETVPYEYYINQIMYLPVYDKDLYKLADKIEAEKTPPPTPPKTFSQMMLMMQSSAQ